MPFGTLTTCTRHLECRQILLLFLNKMAARAAAKQMKNVLKKAIASVRAPPALGPYSQAVRTQKTLYCSGCLGLNPQTKALENGVEKQAKQALLNMKAILEEENVQMDNIVRTTVYLKNMSDFQRVNAIYASFFTAPFPSRSCVAVAQLPMDALVEVDCIAAVPSQGCASKCGSKNSKQ